MFFPRHWPARTLTQLFELRKERDAQLAEKPAVWNLLVISGRGDWGAFGAGFIKGWSHEEGPLTDRQTLVHQTQPIPWH